MLLWSPSYSYFAPPLVHLRLIAVQEACLKTVLAPSYHCIACNVANYCDVLHRMYYSCAGLGAGSDHSSVHGSEVEIGHTAAEISRTSLSPGLE